MGIKICRWCGADLDSENGKLVCNNCKQPQEIILSEVEEPSYIG